MTAADTGVRRASIQFPGGLAARLRWAGSGQAAEVFALSEEGGLLVDHGPLVAADPDRLCRAELRIEGPVASWTARFASPIYDEPSGLLWDDAGLFLVRYGFQLYALDPRRGELAWSHRSGSPLLAVLASSRLPHLLVQSEVETVALDAGGQTVWRLAHSDVVTEAELVGGRLILTSYSGQRMALDAQTGRRLD
jgi:outer membrane protein assembly factor BamB